MSHSEIIPSEHEAVHHGITFHASYKSPEGGDIADNGTILLQITTGARYCHLVFSCAMGGDAEVEFFEGITSTGGTPIQAHNMNRSGVMTPSAAVVHTPTPSAYGTRLENILVPGGIGGNSPGGSMATRNNTEWILKVNTKYLLRLTNRGGSASPGGAAMQWYEKDHNEAS